MKKLTLLVATMMIATFTFAQNSGQWSFGAGADFTSPDASDSALRQRQKQRVERARPPQILAPLLVLLGLEAGVHRGLLVVAGAPELAVDVRVVALDERVDERRALRVRPVERRVHGFGGAVGLLFVAGVRIPRAGDGVHRGGTL